MKLIFILLIFSAEALAGKEISPLARKSGSIFYAAIDARKSHQSVEKTCGDKELPWKVFCLEGWYFQHYLFQWGKQPELLQNWAWPPFTKPIEALSAGLAWGYLKRPFPQAVLSLKPQYAALFTDGWAFLDRMNSFEEGRVPVSCWDGPQYALKIYCEFGKGRAQFFLPPKSLTYSDDKGSFAALGLRFARAFHGEKIPGAEDALNRIVTGILRPDSTSPELRECLKEHHQIDCLEINQ